MYVIKPPLYPGISKLPSYNCWATDIVRRGENPNFKDASCCIVEVVNGATGFLVVSFSSISAILQIFPCSNEETISRAVASFGIDFSVFLDL